ncbi:hypothetical protein LPJ61_006468 [Coemansia biformis]|uniref:DH domain-containing protein n=1 Tax=Coemansia biformis TaxID=1286918 RepID=A0A9W8CP73_9FUNG|nr:hypothetical protein LPJ61_006468 [Coemansia biformis]
MRPVQRLAQYPILFRSIADALDESTMSASQKAPAVESACAALQQSRQILIRANETTREALNETQLVQFFARLDDPLGGIPDPQTFGRLLTSDKVLAQVGRSFEDLEGYLFEHMLVVCQADRVSKPSRMHRTISMLQMTIKSPARSKREDRRRSGSSVSSSTLNSPNALRARSPVPDSHSPEDKLALPTVGFQLPAIDTGHSIALDAPSPPSPMLTMPGSHVSLNTLRDRPSIRFAPSTPMELGDTDTSSRGCLPRLIVRVLVPTSAISQISQLSEVDGSFRLNIQAMMDDGTPALIVFKQLSKEAAGIWLRMLQRAVHMVPVEESVARGNDNYSLLVNPKLSMAALGKRFQL